MNKQPQLFIPSDLVFFSEKYVIENLEQCITIAYATITNNKNPNYEFDVSDIPVYVLYCIISVIVNLLYSSQATRFQKYLGTSGSNIKLGNGYFVLRLFEFSKSGQIIIEATDIDYLRTSTLNHNTFENSFLINSKTLVDASVKIDDKHDEPDFEDEDGLDDDAQIENEEHEENL
ncbi:17992_t:CDS:2 [Gigaspora margarita]|uniref:17992_t:CDS:1 n=1 Tax=Gigaspora margarita TaxID=4874 RepID=A0ABN7VKJ6_GIGMA|nr:17992_t:CDS:2 [Gigaspora margarita]